MILDEFRLTGKVALVTGCNTGLGQGIAIGLAEAGADIVGIVCKTGPVKTKKAIKEKGGRFLYLEENLLSIEPVNRIIESAVKEFGLRENKERNAEILGRIPAGRWGTPEDLKGIAVFLASRASDYINGYTIAVDGGWLAR